MSDPFWDDLNRGLRPKKTEGFWQAQRGRVLARLREGRTSRWDVGAVRRWLPVPALAGAALAAFLLMARRAPQAPEGSFVPAQDWEFLESMDLLQDLDVLMEASQLDRL